MSRAPYRTPSLRAASCVSQDGAGRRMVSADGLRWAISRNQKRHLGNRTFDIVECWTLKARVNGKAVIVTIQRDEASAKRFIESGAL